MWVGGKFKGQLQKKKYPDVKLHPGKFEDGPGKKASPNHFEWSESMKFITSKPTNTCI